MSRPDELPAHLEPSKLGTKEYWDELYTSELRNHAADPSDIGTVWFDDSDAEAKTVELLDDLLSEQQQSDPLSAHPSTAELIPPKHLASLLDLGCGNASLLFTLRAAGWTGRARGVDYSPHSIALARQVGASLASSRADQDDDDDAGDNDEGNGRRESPTHPPAPVELDVWDVLGGPFDAVLDGAQVSGWDVVLDKGTFDAISLASQSDDAQGRRPCESYCDRVLRLVRPGGLFVITSCNWTEEELVKWFASTPDASGDAREQQQRPGRFVVRGRIQYRTFNFGGVKGQTISTMAFVKQ
ncbi:hypothetical protein HIM_04473 [Hirsutella minnesotensis 3608]|uniref:Protein-lysine N-methyltransferase EFM4 n=1 Tax=Hirsutella minnesotensis 3608 TaxID=1043627 RepID=A0A0F8A195_9HYPO|nr:hypothetical protein HIM_04473 [Hirsutella minnesotensis 3608]